MKAIVYTSNTGYTAAYAKILSDKTGLPALEMEQARKQLPKGTHVIYMGWLFVGGLKGYKRAARRFAVKAVCGVGLCDTGALQAEVRKSIRLPENIPLFTMQGGMDHSKLRGIYKYMIDMLVKMLSQKKDRTEGEDRMLELIQTGGSFVCEENTALFMAWYNAR